MRKITKRQKWPKVGFGPTRFSADRLAAVSDRIGQYCLIWATFLGIGQIINAVLTFWATLCV